MDTIPVPHTSKSHVSAFRRGNSWYQAPWLLSSTSVDTKLAVRTTTRMPVGNLRSIIFVWWVPYVGICQYGSREGKGQAIIRAKRLLFAKLKRSRTPARSASTNTKQTSKAFSLQLLRYSCVKMLQWYDTRSVLRRGGVWVASMPDGSHLAPSLLYKDQRQQKKETRSH